MLCNDRAAVKRLLPFGRVISQVDRQCLDCCVQVLTRYVPAFTLEMSWLMCPSLWQRRHASKQLDSQQHAAAMLSN